MTQAIEVESIRRLDINPGETLVVGLPERATPEDVARVHATLPDYLPDGVDLLVVAANVDLSVIAADQCPSSPA